MNNESNKSHRADFAEFLYEAVSSVTLVGVISLFFIWMSDTPVCPGPVWPPTWPWWHHDDIIRGSLVLDEDPQETRATSSETGCCKIWERSFNKRARMRKKTQHWTLEHTQTYLHTRVLITEMWTHQNGAGPRAELFFFLSPSSLLLLCPLHLSLLSFLFPRGDSVL